MSAVKMFGVAAGAGAFRPQPTAPNATGDDMTTTVTITTIRDDGTPFGAELSVGDVAQKHVLRKFNPTDNPTVDATKVLCAAIIQQMLNLRDDPLSTAPQKRAASIAITQCEALQMQAVKANFVQA